MDLKNTSDFVSGFWNIYIDVIVLVSIFGCAAFLWVQSSAKNTVGHTTGHVWDEDLKEYNNPMPNWWRWLFYITIVFGLIYLVMYPGLGSYRGSGNARTQYDAEMVKAEQDYGPRFERFRKQDVA